MKAVAVRRSARSFLQPKSSGRNGANAADMPFRGACRIRTSTDGLSARHKPNWCPIAVAVPHRLSPPLTDWSASASLSLL